MVDTKVPLTPSIQLRLSVALSCFTLCAALLGGVSSFFLAYREANELQDQALESVMRSARVPASFSPPSAQALTAEHEDEQPKVIIRPLSSAQGSGRSGSLAQRHVLSEDLADGFQTITLGAHVYRVLVGRNGFGERFAVLQDTAFRNDMARDSAIRTVLPMLLLVVSLPLLVFIITSRMFQPLRQLAAVIDQRESDDLRPIQARMVPQEVRSFLVAINRLLERIEHVLMAQRRFIADAAHELRTPLAALSLQVERLETAPDGLASRERLLVLRQGLERTRHLLDQLLTLARVESTPLPKESSSDVGAAIRGVIELVIPLAEAADVVFDIDLSGDLRVGMCEADLFILIRNLVDNSLRYSPAGATVQILAHSSGSTVQLQLRDSGPGIPIGEHSRVFDPFYRSNHSVGVGSGLGLAIVKTILQRINGTIRLDYAESDHQSGLLVTVEIPAPLDSRPQCSGCGGNP
jgi:two-component system OmpR family sensor kinase